MKHDIMGQLDQKYDKICMITVEIGLLISGRKGIKVWNKLMEMNMRQVEQCLQDDRLHLYRDTLWCFYFAADRSYPADLFLQKAEMIFRECGYCFDGECRLIAVNRFYVVVDEEIRWKKFNFVCPNTAAAICGFVCIIRTIPKCLRKQMRCYL